MFSRAKVVGSEDAIETHRRQIADETKTMAEIDALAVVAEVEALTKKDSLLAEVIAEHERDCRSYKFDCRRWGDFLSLFIERSTETYATSVNIRETRELKFIEGNEPDSNGSLEYYINLRNNNGHSSGWGTGYGRAPAPKGYHYFVYPYYPTTRPHRSLFALDPRPVPNEHRVIHLSSGDNTVRHRTPNFPRAAGDDRIRFEGIDATLFAPAGRGRSIYETILREIGEYQKQR